MKGLIIVFMMVGLMAMALPVASADNFLDDVTDVIKGRNEDLLVDLYVAYTTKGNIPFIPGNIRIKVSTPYGERFGEEGRIQTGIEF